MSENMVGEKRASEAADYGVNLGMVGASRESKGAWSELFYHKGELISVMLFDHSNCEVIDGELIEESEMGKHVSDLEKAKELLAKEKETA